MRRAFELAELGKGSVSPNPLVGCVIVCEGRIIGEGWHQQYGGPHAEVNALNSVRDTQLIRNSTVYVNLEPCAHRGKTPPCADRLIREGVKKVVISNKDTNPSVRGGGAAMMTAAGIETEVGLLSAEGRYLNRRFFTAVEKKRPFVILKWAETADGFIARENLESKWISHDWSRNLVHQWRAHEDGVLVGTRTAQHDNPRLNVRTGAGRNPCRIVADRFLRLNERLHLFDRTQPTLCYNLLKHEEHPNLTLVRLGEENFWADLLTDLSNRNIQSIMVEGGAMTLNVLLEAGWWDEIRMFRSPRTFGKGIAAPRVQGHLHAEHQIADDLLQVFQREVVTRTHMGID
ncbi:MAG: bifunctional diaminohydroxyphosphoribosylaminopyrimidine deaminase/5-amino-6-(5-phosphoribosylamino)uracil reductase RibD [Bacteroidetes bacterium]|nr:bifunctional diaminohydroxyphosphoribosylaminopyrimidine deaminase/5-amino-6-(5-phosphoribosylamino)uracil reductase RibD [Bacteroidota bacterium]